MATRHFIEVPAIFQARSGLGSARLGRFVHLSGMETTNAHRDLIEQILSMSELAARLRVSVQTLYDPRSQGRGPRGFRVGRRRFRVSELDSLALDLSPGHGSRGSSLCGLPRTSRVHNGVVFTRFATSFNASRGRAPGKAAIDRLALLILGRVRGRRRV